jgi:hypothetical protein
MTWRDQTTASALERLRSGPASLEDGQHGAGVDRVGPEDGSERPVSDRILSIDALRGIALLYMLVSHTAIGAGVGWWPRGVGFMLFVVVAGSLYRRRLGRRYIEIVGAGILSIPASLDLGLNGFNILLAWGVALPVLWVLTRSRLLAVVIVVVGSQLLWWWPLGGSNPGLVLLGWAIGYVLGRDRLAITLRGLPTPSWLLWIGRHPLTFFVGHLWVLAAIL